MEQGRKRVMTGWKGISAAKWIRWGILFLAGLILAGEVVKDLAGVNDK